MIAQHGFVTRASDGNHGLQTRATSKNDFRMSDSDFHLEPPPGFQGLDPAKEVTCYQRNLPHWRQQGATYFVTFRLIDSLPASKLNELRALRQELACKLRDSPSEVERWWREHAKNVMKKSEAWLDQGMGSCLLKEETCREIVYGTLLFFHLKRHETGAFVVMPNHVHVLLRPLEDESLEKILMSIKRESSRTINAETGKSGALWQEESYDRIVREPEHLWKCLQYIGKNPAKANLGEGKELRWVSETWQQCGWDFVE